MLQTDGKTIVGDERSKGGERKIDGDGRNEIGVTRDIEIKTLCSLSRDEAGGEASSRSFLYDLDRLNSVHNTMSCTLYQQRRVSSRHPYHLCRFEYRPKT